MLVLGAAGIAVLLSQGGPRTVRAKPAALTSTAPPAAIALSDGWRYVADPGDVGLREHWANGGPGLPWAQVTMPDDFNATVTATSNAGTIGWYELQFTGPPTAPGRAWDVRFAEVRRHAEVWLNGREIGSNSDPYAPFSVPATTLRSGRPNVLVVRVDNLRGRGSLPQDWWNWGGIVQPVTLEPVGRVTLRDLGVMPELGCRYRCGELLVEGIVTNLTRTKVRPEIEVRVTSPGGKTFVARDRLPSIGGKAAIPVGLRVPVPGRAQLWSPDDPALYRVTVETLTPGRVEQSQSLRVGMRAVQVRGGLLYLNGRRLWLHGAAIHEDISGRGAALIPGDIDTIVSELRSAGANITRAHYLLSEPLLDALDAAGILVWEQAPVDHADPVLRTAAGRGQALATVRATVLGARSHPSVIVDSVGNELSPTPDTAPGTRSYLDQAISLARRLDPTAAVALDTYCYPAYPAQSAYTKLDVLGINSYFGWYTGTRRHSIASLSGLEPFLRSSRARYPHQAVVISEYGAEGVFDGAATTKGSYEFQGAYLGRTLGIVDRLPFLSGSIYWILRDFAEGPGWTGGAQLPAGVQPDGLDHKGLIAYDGTQKPAFSVAEQLLGQVPPFAR
jgi:Glycosyl hydrolases family 2, TIM barrel domain/Glycosyl hydrolases family 2, sugar binding domain/Glycosyl hydrolases family 2